MAKIQSLSARQILDSRGEPTIETSVVTEDGQKNTASVPSGASTGTFEAKIATDPSDESKEAGIKVAIENVHEVANKIHGLDVRNQKEVDAAILELDGTSTKAHLGANTTLSVSLAVAKAGANCQNIPLWKHITTLCEREFTSEIPTPLFNFFEGGKHADNLLEFQEFLLIPTPSLHFSQQLVLGTTLYHRLKTYLLRKNLSTLNADEGGFAPELATNKRALDLLREVIEGSGNILGKDTYVGIDAAANTFQTENDYKLEELGGKVNRKKLVDFYKDIQSTFSLSYIEDPFGEEDTKGWKEIMQKIGDNTQIVGDDLTTTNPFRLQTALDEHLINALIIKPNQIGTLSETIAVAEIAKHSGLKITVSHRSGETEDTCIADIAVGIGADQAKFGAPARERVLKYNRLTEISQEIQQA